MREYIDREKAIETIRLTYCKDCNNYNGVRCRACEFDDAMSEIEDCPTADVVEVVRCKDCIHKGWVQEPCHGRSIAYCHIHELCIREDDFCSYGERKEQRKEDEKNA